MSFLTKRLRTVAALPLLALGVLAGAAARAQTPVTEEVARLTAFDGGDQHVFGRAVAVSGDLVAIGAQGADGVIADTGAVYLYERNRGGADSWSLVLKVEEPDSAALDDFGYSVALANDTLAVGAWENDAAGTNAGAVYVYERNQGGGDNWGLVKKLTAGDPVTHFGASVSIDRDTLAVGALDDSAGGNGAGAAYLFERNLGGADNWGQAIKLTAFDAIPGDLFGTSVALRDGVLAIGSPREDSAAGPGDRGSVYLYGRNIGGADNWGLDEKIANPDPDADDWFGQSVSLDGRHLAIGVPRDGALNGGAVYVYERPATAVGSWTQVVRIPTTDIDLQERFGWSLALAGEFLLVSGYLDRDAGFATGAAYLFRRNQGGADNWGLVKKILASDLAASQFFGIAVALDVDTLLLGASGTNEVGTNAGAAYVHNLRGERWREVREINGTGTLTNEWFGVSVDLDGDEAVVGARRADLPGFVDAGAAFVFERNLGGQDGWGQTQKLVPSDPDASAFFGVASAISGDIVAVGADQKDEAAGVRAGAVYLYRRVGSTWSFLAKITPSDPAADDRFGFALALCGQTLAVGAYGKNGVSSDSGAVYLFRRNQGGADAWGQVKKITASDAGTLRWFGWSVALDGDTLVVGSPTNLSSQPGAAYLYERNQGGADNWGEVKKITGADSANGDKFGYSVGIDGDRVVGGAPNHFGIGTNSGATYLFERNFDPVMPGFPNPDFWGQRKKLQASNQAIGDEFGRRVAIEVDTIAVGTAFEDESPDFNRGSVYVYERNFDPLAPATPAADNWGEVMTFRAGETTNGDRFGDAVALSDMTLLAGAPFGDGPQVNSGSAYVFDRNHECLASFALPAGQWKQISLACDMPPPTTVLDVFSGSLAPADYAATWIVYRWDPVAEANVALLPGNQVSEGQGYWIKTNQIGKSVEANAEVNPVIDVPLTEDPIDGRSNMAGHPFDYDVCWADVQVVDGGVPIGLDAADPGGACQADPVGPGCVMSRIAHKWSGASYDAFDGQTPGARGTLESFDGLWVKAFKSGISLRIPATPASGDCEAPPAAPAAALAPATSAPNTKRGGTGRREPATATSVEEWFLRLTARSGDLVERGSVFGQTADSRRGPDSHDLPDLAPFSSPSLSIVFPHPDWRSRPGDYATDFHRLRRGADRWEFEVRADGLGEPVRLAWKGPPEILARSVLTDLATGRKVRPTAGGVYEITLGSGSRAFRWRLRPERRSR